MADPSNLNTCAIEAQSVLQPALDVAVVALLLHVDEVDHDQAGEVAQLDLARDFVSRFLVCVERGFFDGEFARRLTGVDVDRDQRFGLVDHQIAAGAQVDVRAEHGVQLPLDLEAVKQRLRLLIQSHVLDVARHQHAHEVLGFLMRGAACNDDFVDVLGIEVADRTLDQVTFLVDEARRRRLQSQIADVLPQAQQVFEVALDLLLGPRCTGGADDQAHAFRHFELGRNGLQTLAVLCVGNLAADAAAACRIRHQHGVAAGEREVRRQRGALAATFFLDDLHQDDLAPLDDFLDLVAALAATRARGKFLERILRTDAVDLFALGCAVGGFRGIDLINADVLDQTDRLRRIGGTFVAVVRFSRGFCCRGSFGGLRSRRAGFLSFWCRLAYTCIGRHGFGDGARRFRLGLGLRLSRGLGLRRQEGGDIKSDDFLRRILVFADFIVISLPTRAAALGGCVGFRFFLGVGRGFFVDQRLPVGNRDLVIVRMDLVEGQEAVTVAAVIDEGSLQRRLNARNLGEIDAAAQKFTGSRFEVEFLYAATFENHDPSLLGVGGIDKHLVAGHVDGSFARRRGTSQGAAMRPRPKRRPTWTRAMCCCEKRISERGTGHAGAEKAACATFVWTSSKVGDAFPTRGGRLCPRADVLNVICISYFLSQRIERAWIRPDEGWTRCRAE